MEGLKRAGRIAAQLEALLQMSQGPGAGPGTLLKAEQAKAC
jgi:hypothetical protein